MKQTINQPMKFVNESTKTLTIAYPKFVETIEKHTHFLPEEISNCDGYILSFPFGHEQYPIVATFKDGYIDITIDRDCYQFEMNQIHLVGEIAEIYFETEDVTLVREYLVNYKGQNKIK